MLIFGFECGLWLVEFDVVVGFGVEVIVWMFDFGVIVF